MRSLKITWLLACAIVLGITLHRYEPSSDIGVFFIYGMLLLTFPAGLAVAALVTALVIAQERFQVPILDVVSSNHLGLLLLWAVFAAVGYWQWFHLLPSLVRKWKTRGARSAG